MLIVLIIYIISALSALKYLKYRRNFLSSYEWYFSKFLAYWTILCHSEVFYADRRGICCIFEYALLNILIAQGRWINRITAVSRDRVEGIPYGVRLRLLSSIDLFYSACETRTLRSRKKDIPFIAKANTVVETNCFKNSFSCIIRKDKHYLDIYIYNFAIMFSVFRKHINI